VREVDGQHVDAFRVQRDRVRQGRVVRDVVVDDRPLLPADRREHPAARQKLARHAAGQA
jgi:hypothetical protein